MATASNEIKSITYVPFERADYAELQELQQQAIINVRSNPLEPKVFIGSFAPVITQGRGQRSISDAADEAQIPVFDVERGGFATYHGPGQLVVYPIFALETLNCGRDLHAYLRWLEDILIETIAPFGLVGTRSSLDTGVWVGKMKLASIGIAVKKWVTYHGIALNVSTDLKAFHQIQPCGFDASVMTTMEKELGHTVDFGRVVESFKATLMKKLRPKRCQVPFSSKHLVFRNE